MSHDNNRTNKNEKDKKDREKKGKHIDITTTINNKPKCLPTIFRLINSKNYNIVYSWSSSSLCYALPGLLTHIVNGISIYACMIYIDYKCATTLFIIYDAYNIYVSFT